MRPELTPDVMSDPAGAAALVAPIEPLMREPFGSAFAGTFASANAVLRDTRLGVPTIEDLSFGVIVAGPVAEWTRRSSSFLDGAPHRAVRSAVAPAFTPAAVGEVRDLVRAASEEVVAEVTGRPRVDLVSEVADRFPRAVFGALLGASFDEIDSVSEHVTALARLFSFDAGSPEWLPLIEAGLPAIERLAAELWGRRIGLVGRLHDLGLDATAGANLVSQLLVAGWETTGAQAAAVLAAVTSSPAAWSDALGLGDDAAVVLEAVRLSPAAPATLRMTLEDTDLFGVEVPARTLVVSAAGWANRDGSVFDAAGEWRPGRWVVGDLPRPLGFGAGRHQCLGERLALLELAELVRSLRTAGPPGGWHVVEPVRWVFGSRPSRPERLVVEPTAR